MNTTTMTDELWIELFTVELRMRRVPGPVIGDALASVTELLADSGQSAEEAFGAPREYADSLDLPAEGGRRQAVRTVVQPVIGLIAFITFALASTAMIEGEPIMLSALQAAVLAIPVVLTLMFIWPLYIRSMARLRWMPAVVVAIAAVSGAVSALLAPASDADAWLVFSAVPVVVVTAAVLVLIAVIGTVQNVRSRHSDAIVDPIRGAAPANPRRLLFLIATAWIFPIFAALMFGMIWLLDAFAG
ncbi:hypothetical protein [Agromyces archimandritae]|uniref:Uncharacterized protein n=1 Tax=Agromyces archimandritae TaxID=2781962 RepID=A0A975FLJ8_9MICO|nr:hypothetical protein [Agromyces archimandritae]QTX04713.1 hypothetical protein G127AT_00070 [Agromyces archimandritae]